MATQLHFHILKFSHATVDRPGSNISWVHLTSSHLVVLLNQHHSSGVLQLQIVDGSNVLERVDLGSLIDATIDVRRRAKVLNYSPTKDELPTFGLTKDLSIAIKYRRTDGRTRRLQIRFGTPKDCQQVLDILEQRGMEIDFQRPSTGRPDTASSQNRSLAVQTNSPYFEQAPSQQRSGGFRLSSVEAGSLSQTHQPVRQEIPGGQTCNASDITSSDDSARPSTSVQTQPALSQFYGRPSASLQSQIAFAEPRPSTSPVKSRHVTHVLSKGTVYGSMSVPGSSSTLRASSTSIPLENETPPCQGLPFKRPHNRSEEEAARPTESALGLPPLPVPKTKDIAYSTNPPAGSAYQNVEKNSRPRTASPLKSSIATPDSDADREVTQGRTGVLTYGNRHLPTLQAEKPILSAMDELLARPVENPATGIGVPRVSSLLDAPHEILSPPHSSVQFSSRIVAAGPSSLARQTANKDFTIRPTAAGLSHEQEAFGLASYASQSREDRTAALDEFMMSMLEDPSFTVLCQDVENCWRRIALGL